jgi:hypothetical protein
MKTSRCFFLIVSLGVSTQGLSFAETSTEATPKATSQNVANEAHGKQSGHEAKAQDTGSSGGKRENSKDDAKSTAHSTAVPDEGYTAGNRQFHGPHLRPTGNTRSASGRIPGSSVKPGGTSVLNVPNRTGVGNVGNQSRASLNKPGGGVNGPSGAKKGQNFSALTVVPQSAGKLPTAPALNAAHGRVAGLATIGGPVTSKTGNTAVINGTGTKHRF